MAGRVALAEVAHLGLISDLVGADTMGAHPTSRRSARRYGAWAGHAGACTVPGLLNMSQPNSLM